MLRDPVNPNIDFEASGVNSEKFIFLDHKVRIDFKRLEDKGIDI